MLRLFNMDFELSPIHFFFPPGLLAVSGERRGGCEENEEYPAVSSAQLSSEREITSAGWQAASNFKSVRLSWFIFFFSFIWSR